MAPPPTAGVSASSSPACSAKAVAPAWFAVLCPPAVTALCLMRQAMCPAPTIKGRQDLTEEAMTSGQHIQPYCSHPWPACWCEQALWLSAILPGQPWGPLR